jgi:hypothetical protein
MNADALAFELLAELQRRVGSMAVEQVDLVLCEDQGRTVMAYCYAPDGSCEPISFARPPFYDPDALRAALLMGYDARTVH